MGCRAAVLLLTALVPMATARLEARSSLLFAHLNYESPSIVAPVAALVLPAGDDTEWAAGLFGWTLSGSWSTSLRSEKRLVVSADLTPLNYNSSEYVYRSGERDRGLSYESSALEVRLGLDLRHSRDWQSQVFLVGLLQSVTKPDDPELERFWADPFAGLEVVARYRNTVSDDPYLLRWDGLKAFARLRAFNGRETWWRGELSVGGGKRLGRGFVGARASWLGGERLNAGNEFLVGGSWELPGTIPLHGYQYAELRVERGLVLGAGFDVNVVGDWNVGLRASRLDSPAVDTYGAALKISTVWKGFGFSLGVGVPREALVGDEDFSRSVVFGGVTGATFHPFRGWQRRRVPRR
jgi:hypothetical protein